MWDDFIAWRQKTEADTILSTWKFEEAHAVSQVYPQFYHGIDKKGRPIYIEQLGRLNVADLWKATTRERMFRNYIHSFEHLLSFRYPCVSAVKGQRIDQTFSIIDMTDFSAGKMNSETRGILSEASGITSNNYPENLGMMFVINAPFVFSACWSIAKGFLDERTVKKI